MGQAVAITNRDQSAEALRQIAARHEAAVVRRLLALILDGHSRREAARQNGMDRQTLCDWVHRDNAPGVAGLSSRVAPGAAPRLDETQMAELEALVLAGPDPETDGVVRWRCVDLQQVILTRWNIAYHERTIGKLLRRLGFRHISARPRHLGQDPAQIEEFKKVCRAGGRDHGKARREDAGRNLVS